jgi:hypothetical protein
VRRRGGTRVARHACDIEPILARGAGRTREQLERLAPELGRDTGGGRAQDLRQPLGCASAKHRCVEGGHLSRWPGRGLRRRQLRARARPQLPGQCRGLVGGPAQRRHERAGHAADHEGHPGPEANL